jgi:hypothetical protein
MSEAIHINKKSKSIQSMASNVKAAAGCKIHSKKPEQWVLRLSNSKAKLLQQFCLNKAIVFPYVEESDAIKQKLIDACYDGYLNRWKTDQSRPSNPLVQILNDEGVVDCQLLFILNDKFNVNIVGPQETSEFNEDWATKAAIDALTNAGLTKAKATKFVEMEIDCAITCHFLTLSEMMEGHIGTGRRRIPPSASTQEAGRKMLLFLNWSGKSKNIEPLTEDEINAITYNKVSWIPRPGMLERVFNYAKSLEELKIILSIFSPVLSIRSEEFGVSDTNTSRNNRLSVAAVTKFV